MDPIGTVLEIGRFPVKSMQGESPDRAAVGAAGIVGDRTHGLLDVATGKIASAKDPRAWGQLLGFRAVWEGEALAITGPEAEPVDDLSAALGREVRLVDALPEGAVYDYVWEVEGIAPDEIVAMTQTGTNGDGFALSAMPMAMSAPGTFQDVAPITLMTTAALATMAGHHPEGDWSPIRFRNNLLLAVDGDGIVENGWEGRRLAVGDVVLEVTGPAPRCVMTTLPQLGLPRDRGVLQAVAKHNKVEFAGLGLWACLGAYANVVTPGEVAVGDEVRLL